MKQINWKSFSALYDTHLYSGTPKKGNIGQFLIIFYYCMWLWMMIENWKTKNRIEHKLIICACASSLYCVILRLPCLCWFRFLSHWFLCFPAPQLIVALVCRLHCLALDVSSSASSAESLLPFGGRSLFLLFSPAGYCLHFLCCTCDTRIFSAHRESMFSRPPCYSFVHF